MTDRQKQFEAQLKEFPKSVRDILQTIPLQAGRLSAQQCADLIKNLGIDPEALMVRLLPLATIYAVAPVSQFRVGAVAMAGEQGTQDHADPFELFLGANMEFMHQPLNQTIHAEQSASLHAWHRGARYLHAVATSEAPCGYCRQFLYEFDKNAEMMVITPDRQNRTYRKTPLSDLLPEAFGPLDLGNRSGLMSPAPQDRKLRLNAAVKNRTIDEALAAAEKSYAPYTQNFAGCALETQTGEIYGGRYVESAAYNPSLTPLQSAILCMNMATLEEQRSIQRVVLVEKPTAVRQRKVVELLLESWAPGIELEYYEIN
jgi:cytidine deaminase